MFIRSASPLYRALSSVTQEKSFMATSPCDAVPNDAETLRATRQKVDRLFRQLDVAGAVTSANDERLDVRQRRRVLEANLKTYIKDQDLGRAGQDRAG
jgi:hypothetical protein